MKGAGIELHRIVDELPGLIWTAGPDGKVDFLNKRWSEYTGLTLDEAYGFGWQTVIHTEDLPGLLEILNAISPTSDSFETEARFRRRDGKYRWFLVRVSPVTDESGRVVKLHGINTDIDDRKRDLEDLQALETNFNRIVESVPVPVAVTTPTGEVEALNRPTLEYFGRTFEELKGWKSSDVVHPDDLERTVAAQTAAHIAGTSFNVESRHLRHDGVYRWFNVLGLPLRDNTGNNLRWFILQIDIDDRKRAEELLRSRETDLSQIINTIPALAWSARPDGSAEFFNQHYLDYMGLSRAEAKDWGWTAAVHPDDLQRLGADWQRILASEQPGESEARLRRNDGEYVWFMFRANPLRDKAGNISNWYGINIDIEDRKQSERSLVESEQKFRAIFDEAGAGITLLDLKTEAPIVNNRAMKSMLNSTDDELRTVEMFTALTVENERDLDLELFRELRRGEREHLRQEKHFILKDGRSVWANVIFTLLRDPNGTPWYVISIHEDITERKLALEKLQERDELLDLAQKAARAMAFDWNIRDGVNTWSPEQEALYGLSPGTFDGTYKSWKELIHPKDWPQVVKALKHAQETGDISAEFRVVWPDGSTHWLSANGQMFLDDAGQPYRMVGFTADVTRRKVVEEELRRSEAFLAQSQAVNSTGSFLWRVAADEITWSDEVYRIFEFEIGEPVTLDRIGSRVYPDDIPMMQDMVGRARSDDSGFEYEHRLLMPDGSIKYVHLVAHGITDDDGQVEYIGAVQDVTERKVAEEALSQVRSELAHVARITSLGALTASIAHEVSQPLSGIITNASTCLRMLSADPPNVEGALETVRRTLRDGNRASDVITRLRALFSKKESIAELVDLNQATREVIALSMAELQRRSVILRTTFADDVPTITGDRIQLQQVILNLVLNASDAMSEIEDRPRHLTIKTERYEPEGGVCLTVQDAGVGIESQGIDQLFEPFYTTKSKGMGIGLFVSRSIIEKHNGRLWASSNDGPGATFAFSIPRGPEAKNVPAHPAR